MYQYVFVIVMRSNGITKMPSRLVGKLSSLCRVSIPLVTFLQAAWHTKAGTVTVWSKAIRQRGWGDVHCRGAMPLKL